MLVLEPIFSCCLSFYDIVLPLLILLGILIKALSFHSSSLMPWLQVDGDLLYLTQAEEIRAYQLRPDGSGFHRRPYAVFLGHQEDVCRFVVTNSHIISGGG